MDLYDHSTPGGILAIIIRRLKWPLFVIIGILGFVILLSLYSNDKEKPIVQSKINPKNFLPLPLKKDATNSGHHKFIIIDTDAGIDDAWAIFACIRAHRDSSIPVTVVAITTTHGNTNLEHVTRNLAQILDAAKEQQIPVFIGSASALLIHVELSYNPFVGADGFGDAVLPNVSSIKSLQPEHAVNAIARLANEYGRKMQNITILCLGPLTNLATALRLSPSLSTNLAEVIVLGGNLTEESNRAYEFNFYTDPEAAYIVFENLFPTPIRVVPWVALLHEPQLTCEFRMKTLGEISSREMTLLNRIESIILENCEDNWFAIDSLLVAVLIDPTVMLASKPMSGRIELTGVSRSTLLVYPVQLPQQRPNILVVTKFNISAYQHFLIRAVSEELSAKYNLQLYTLL